MALLWVVYLLWVLTTWLGLLGAAMVCVAATRWLRRMQAPQTIAVRLQADELQHIWVGSLALCVHTRQGLLWVCRDELPAPRWAALRRWAHRHVPGQAVGLSMSR